MKNIYLFIVMLLFTNLVKSQLVNYEVEILSVERSNYTDCTACGTPDPTWIMDLNDNATAAVSNLSIHISGNGTVLSAINSQITSRTNTSATSFTIGLDAWEDNCNSDVYNFNNYNFFNCSPSVYGDSRRCTNNNIVTENFRTEAPCVWHTGTSAWCGDFRFTYRYRWSFNQAPGIAVQPSPVVNDLCIGNSINLSVTPTTDVNGWLTGSNYQWQVSSVTECASTNAASWSNVGGANASTFTPPQTPGTRLYRVLVTSNCTSTFTSNTTASNCVRVSYNTFGITGDTPPDIQSGICGSIVLPGSSHSLSALLPPAVGAANGVTFSWSATGGTFTQNTGSTTSWNAPTTAGNYIITLTYVDACGQTDAFSTCVIDVGSPNCDFAYVATTGVDDVFAGGPDNPYRTLSYAIAELAGRKYIRMAGGTYNESEVIELENDLVIEGGYEYTAGIWTKTTSQVTNLVLSGFQDNTITGDNNIEHRVGIFGDNDDNFTLQDLTITTTNVTGTTPSNRGRSNYGILLINGSENYNIIRCEITSGNASRGSNGVTPSVGGGSAGATAGGAGGSGANGNGNPGGGSNGTSGTSSAYNATLHNPTIYPTGADGSGGSGGVGTDNCPSGSGCNDGGCDGDDGANGQDGADGRSWQSGDRPLVPISSIPYYVPGEQAGSGQNGGGGGHGAGGNGSRGGRRLCINCDGENGGAGGNGGQGGRGGTGGYGAGGSFSIYTHNSNVGSLITNVDLNIPATEALGGTGANGSSGTSGVNGSNGSCNGCVTASRCSGDGGDGGDGGNGGRGRDGANGVNAHLVIDGVASDPSTSIPNFPIISIDYNNSKACIYSEINLRKDGPNAWSIPLNYVNDLSGSPAPLVTTSHSNGNNEVQVYSTTPGQVVNLSVGGATFNGYLQISNDIRVLPTIDVSPSNLVCIGSTVNLTASSNWGTEVEFDWRIYQGTDVDNPSLSPSTLASPTFDLSGLTPGLYTVRYKVREVCCGWSIPVYDTLRIIDLPIVYQVQGGGGYCQGSLGATVNLSGSENGVSYVLYLNGAPVDTVIGTGAPFNFDPQTTPGNYTVGASSVSNCDRTMQGSVNVFVHPAPNDQNISANGYVCASGANTATPITLNDSEIGVNYQLILNDTVPLGTPISGTDFTISFGQHSTPGEYVVLATNNTTGCTRYLSDTLTLIQLNGPNTYALQGGGSFCAGTAGAAIELSNSDSAVTYQLVWNYTVPIGNEIDGVNGTSLNFGEHSLEGNYTIIATDDLGCESTMLDTLEVDELNPPTFQTVIVDELNCYGDSTASITVSATAYNGNLSYVLNNDTNTTGLFNNLPAGNYLLSIVDDSLCSNIYPVTPIQIDEPAPITISLESLNDVLCFGSSTGAIGVNVVGGAPIYSYTWTSTNAGFTSNNEDISNLEGGTYYLSVSDSKGCTATDTFVVNTPTAGLAATISVNNVLCYGTNLGEASVAVTGGTAPYTYLWHTNDTAQTILNLEPGNVSVTVRDANGCSIYVSNVITGPSTELEIDLLSATNVSCFNGSNGNLTTSISGGATPYSIAWSHSTDTTAVVDNLTAGIYTITVTDANGCVANNSYTITAPDSFAVSIAPTQPGCAGEQTGIAAVGVNGGTAPYNYVWNTNPPQYGIIATQLSGNQWHSVTITDQRGCVTVDSVYIQNPDTLTVSVFPGNTNCVNGTDGQVSVIVNGGTTPFSYELNGNYQVDSFFTGLTPGNYFINVEDNKGCQANTQFVINPNTSVQAELFASSASTVNATDEVIIVSGEEVNFEVVLTNTTDSTEIIEYIWTPLGEFNFSNCTIDTLCDMPSANLTSTTDVIVEVIELVNGAGCSTFDTISIVVRTEYPSFFPTAFSPFSDEFKTDCLNDYFEMNVAGASNLDVKVFNRWGELVFANPNQTNGPADPSTLDCTNPRNAWDGTFEGKPVPMGAYVYQVVATYFNGKKETFSGTVTVLR